MASRLSRSISAESKKLRSLLAEYNSIVSAEDQLSWEDVTNMSLSIWLTPLHEDNLPVPRSVRLAAIDALMKKNRAIEERDLLKVEMENVLHFHLQQYTSLANSIVRLQSVSSVFNQGAICLLKLRQQQYEVEVKACIKSFPKSIIVPDIPFPLETVDNSPLKVRNSALHLLHLMKLNHRTTMRMKMICVHITQIVFQTSVNQVRMVSEVYCLCMC